MRLAVGSALAALALVGGGASGALAADLPALAQGELALDGSTSPWPTTSPEEHSEHSDHSGHDMTDMTEEEMAEMDDHGAHDDHGAFDDHGSTDDHGATDDHGSTDDHGTTDDHGSTDDHGTTDEHGTSEDTVSSGTRTVVLSGFAAVNAGVLAGALLLRRRDRRHPRHGTRAARAGR